MTARAISSLKLIAVLVLSGGAGPIEIAGPVTVMDGDTFRIGAQVVRLHGIDAFENGQDCEDAHGRSYNCGARAENALRKLTANGAACAGTAFDDYGRLIARCNAGGTDLGNAMVSSGDALAFRKYSSEYVEAEEHASAERRGAWRGDFQTPWDFRAARWSSAAQEAPDARCPIKGNINHRGERIYHAPWSRSYARTKVSPQKGEQWFCTEAEALAAGWRAPYR